MLIISLLILVADGIAQQLSETDLIDAATRSYQAGFYDRAAKEFGNIIQRFPNSTRLPELLLYEAHSLFRLGKYDECVTILAQNLQKAGPLTDKYLYWLGEAHFMRGDFLSAANNYSRLTAEFPGSDLLASACVGEAFAWFRLGNLTNTIDLLTNTNKHFSRLVSVKPNDPSILRGFLLLSESLLEQREYAKSEQILNGLVDKNLPPELRWQQMYLLAKVQMSDLRYDGAIKTVNDLINFSSSAGLMGSLPKALLLQGDILLKADQPEAALRAFEQVFNESTNIDNKREALLKMANIYIKINQYDKAIKQLEKFIADNPNDKFLDVVLVTIGEARLQSYKQQLNDKKLERTNELILARQIFSQVTNRFKGSDACAMAWYGLGWCAWEESNYGESLRFFTNALPFLPAGPDHATALLKAGDCCMKLQRFVEARDYFRQVVDKYINSPGISSTLKQQSLSSLIKAAITTDDQKLTLDALAKLTTIAPGEQSNAEVILSVAQYLTLRGDLQNARSWLGELQKLYANSGLLPEAQLLLARIYIRESNFELARQTLDSWLSQWTNNPTIAQVAFERAWLSSILEPATNAYSRFNEFISRYPTNELAPLAMKWLGDYYFKIGDYVSAEKQYQLLFQQTNITNINLQFQARIMAGRSAFARRRFEDATNYFTTLINSLLAETNAPAEFISEAYFRLADTIIELYPPDATNPVGRYALAINALSKIPETNMFGPLAVARIGDCHLQLAAQDPSRYLLASNCYIKVIKMPQSDPRVRSLAEIALARCTELFAALPMLQAIEKTRLLNEALDHYLNVVFEKNISRNNGEIADEFCVEKAGIEAARLSMELGQTNQAINLYSYLGSKIPALKQVMDDRIARIKGN